MVGGGAADTFWCASGCVLRAAWCGMAPHASSLPTSTQTPMCSVMHIPSLFPCSCISTPTDKARELVELCAATHITPPDGLAAALAEVSGERRNPGAAADLLTKLVRMLAEVQVRAASAEWLQQGWEVAEGWRVRAGAPQQSNGQGWPLPGVHAVAVSSTRHPAPDALLCPTTTSNAVAPTLAPGGGGQAQHHHQPHHRAGGRAPRGGMAARV